MKIICWHFIVKSRHCSWLEFVQFACFMFSLVLSVWSKCFLSIPVCFSLCIILVITLNEAATSKWPLGFKIKGQHNYWCHTRVYMKNVWFNMFVFVWKVGVLRVVWLNLALFFISVCINVYSCWQTDWRYNTLLPALFPSLSWFIFCFFALLFAKLDYSQMLSLVQYKEKKFKRKKKHLAYFSL